MRMKSSCCYLKTLDELDLDSVGFKETRHLTVNVIEVILLIAFMHCSISTGFVVSSLIFFFFHFLFYCWLGGVVAVTLISILFPKMQEIARLYSGSAGHLLPPGEKNFLPEPAYKLVPMHYVRRVGKVSSLKKKKS